MNLLKIGKKTEEWLHERKKLIFLYQELGITACEFPRRHSCNPVLSFHHLDKRSSQRAEHTFRGTVLLCSKAHDICEYNQKANDLMRQYRSALVRKLMYAGIYRDLKGTEDTSN